MISLFPLFASLLYSLFFPNPERFVPFLSISDVWHPYSLFFLALKIDSAHPHSVTDSSETAADSNQSHAASWWTTWLIQKEINKWKKEQKETLINRALLSQTERYQCCRRWEAHEASLSFLLHVKCKSCRNSPPPIITFFKMTPCSSECSLLKIKRSELVPISLCGLDSNTQNTQTGWPKIPPIYVSSPDSPACTAGKPGKKNKTFLLVLDAVVMYVFIVKWDVLSFFPWSLVDLGSSVWLWW